MAAGQTQLEGGPMALSLGRAVIARSVHDEAISAENKDCFTPFAMTLRLNLMALEGGLLFQVALARKPKRVSRKPLTSPTSKAPSRWNCGQQRA